MITQGISIILLLKKLLNYGKRLLLIVINIKTGHIHIANPKEDAYIPDLLKITIRLFDREEIIEEIKKMLERCFTK